jgi:hypothetical protein
MSFDIWYLVDKNINARSLVACMYPLISGKDLEDGSFLEDAWSKTHWSQIAGFEFSGELLILAIRVVLSSRCFRSSAGPRKASI